MKEGLKNMQEELRNLEGWMLTVCFDIDGTLIDYGNTPRQKVIDLAKTLLADRDTRVYFWSGGGIPYTEMMCRRLGIPQRVIAKGAFKPDIAIDDEYVTLGHLNLKIS